MSRLTDLLRQVERSDPQLAADLRGEVKALEERRAFGLNFERHVPEAVELPGRPVRRGDKVRILAERGSTKAADPALWMVQRVADGTATLTPPGEADPMVEPVETLVDDLVVVAEFRDPIYPGLVSTGRVERGGPDQPVHTVINAENFHALEMLRFTHADKVDAIYIDPPYNTGAKDWKYNNDYVDSDDAYRHSKWLAFMERRLKLAKELLNPDDSVLIVAIDEKEYLRLGLLLQQVFPEAQMQMVSITISPRSTSRANEFSRVNEFAFFVFIGAAEVGLGPRAGHDSEVRWSYLRRTQRTLVRGSRPRQFYPVYVDPEGPRIVHVGEPMSLDDRLEDVPEVAGAVPVFPINPDGEQLIWGLTGPSLRKAIDGGYVRVTPGNEHQPFTIAYLSMPDIERVADGTYEVRGTREDGSKIVMIPGGKASRPSTVWWESRHDAGAYGTTLIRALISGRRFPFPKSLYAVEDALRFVVADKPDAVVLDFFAGSGTTAHAVMRLNKQDGGRRQCISVTNNEVSAEEQKDLRAKGLRPGDPEWEALGICDYITKPRIEAAVTGRTLDGKPIKGDYKFTDEFPMSDGFEANAEFFTLTYEAPRVVAHNRAFAAIAPLLWLRAGATGRRIEKETDGFDVADTYGVLFDVDAAAEFVAAVSTSSTSGGVGMAFIVTDDERAFQMVCAELPEHVEPVRLYESYLTNFATGGRP